MLPGGAGESLREGFYLVGSGDTGAAAAYGVVGLTYITVMLLSTLTIKKPPTGYAGPIA